GKASGNWVKI
ncbi:unnamed protein product, partial [Allacma fusca]